MPVYKNDMKNKLLKALPQLQCKKCTYKDCESYADAIIKENEDLDKCEPGSIHTQNQLVEIVNGSNDKVFVNEIRNYQIASIETYECIGCTICMKVCPTDAIIGAKHKLHFVIDDLCNGCELCISECPVDCMSMTINPKRESWFWPSEQVDLSRQAYEGKKKRIDDIKKERELIKKELRSIAKMKSYLADAILREEEKDKQLKEYE